jgi:hypothetical protein
LYDGKCLFLIQTALLNSEVLSSQQEHHVAEYILFDGTTTLTDYVAAREASGAVTASFTCDVSLVTTAGEPGSLAPQEGCVIGFDAERPVVWNLPVPISGGINGDLILSDCGYNACVFNESVTPKANNPNVKKSKAPKKVNET